MRVALYGRVSTNHQSVNMQLEALRTYALARCFEVVGEYVDIGISGAKSDRPQLNQMMADAKQRKFDAILVWKLDRFARSLRHLVMAVTDLQEHGVAFISHQENIDLSTAAGRLQFAIIAAMAEFERELIKERVRAGVSRAIASGRQWGRRKIALDFSKVPAGASIRQAAEILGVSRESIRRARHGLGGGHVPPPPVGGV